MKWTMWFEHSSGLRRTTAGIDAQRLVAVRPMRIEIADHFSAPLEELALHSSEATFYHTGGWIDSLSRSFPSMRFRCLTARNGSEIAGYLPFFELKKGPLEAYWSLPFGTYGGPVALGDEAVGRLLVESYAALRRRRSVLEIGLVDFSNRVSEPSFRPEEATTHVIELRGSFDELWDRAFEKSKRRQTRKALREGLAVTEARSAEEVSEYYRIYVQRIERWKEEFRYPERLFTELQARGGGAVRLFLARLGGEILGGHLNFYFKDTVIAWNGVVRDTADGNQASTLLYSECLRHACENGYRSYNLGGSLGKQSLVDYKESLGGAPRTYRTLVWRSAAGKAARAIRTLVPRH